MDWRDVLFEVELDVKGFVDCWWDILGLICVEEMVWVVGGE